MTPRPVTDITPRLATDASRTRGYPAAVLMTLGPDDRVVIIDLLAHPLGRHILDDIARTGSHGSFGDAASGLAAADFLRPLAIVDSPAPPTVVGLTPRQIDISIDGTPDSARLSHREVEVLELIVDGCTNQEIADRLYLSINSIKTYVRTVYRKIGVTRRTQAVSWGFRHGVGAPSPRSTGPSR